MKKTKLSLKALEVKSFNPSARPFDVKVKGGGTAKWETCDDLTQCDTVIEAAIQ